MTSRWTHWSKGNYEDKKGFSSFLAEQESPAEMAKRMGLQSDGSGGYIDSSTGQVVARTVNNELVFYDPQGGAISAQSDGAQLTQDQPSWRDPVTGELTVPPGRPESPEELNAIPDAVPALAPPGYNAFMNAKKKEMYANQSSPEQEEEDEVQQEEDPEMGFPQEEVKTYRNIFKERVGDPQPIQQPQRSETSTSFNTVNSGTRVSSGGKFKHDKPGGEDFGKSTATRESAALEAVHHMVSKNHDREDPELHKKIAAHGYGMKNEDGTTRRPLQNENGRYERGANAGVRKAYDTPWKTGEAMRKVLDLKDGETTDKYLYGRFGGQFTDIPDAERSNLYEDLMEDMQMMIGWDSDEFKQLTPRVQQSRKDSYEQYREALRSYYAGEGEERPQPKPSATGSSSEKAAAGVLAMGKKELLKSKGFDADDVSTQLKDQMQAGDIFMVEKAMENEMREEFQKLWQDYGDNPKIYNQAARFLLQKYQKQKSLLAISLKEVNDGRDAKFSQYNTSMSDTAESILEGDPNITSRVEFNFDAHDPSGILRLKPQDSTVDIESLPFKTGAGGSGDAGGKATLFPINREITRTVDGKKVKEPRYRHGGDEYKLEPVPHGGAAKAGAYSKAKLNQLSRDILGYSFNDYLPTTKKDATQSEDMNDEQKLFWKDLMQEYLDGTKELDDNHYLKLDENSFNYAGEQLSSTDWLSKTLDNYNTTPEEKEAGAFGKDGAAAATREGKPYDPLTSKSEINQALRNLVYMSMFRKSHENASKGVEGAITDKQLFENIMFGASKINYNDEDEFLPYVKVY